MKITKIIPFLLTVVFFVSSMVIANEKVYCCSVNYQLDVVKLGITNQWLEQKSKEFLKLNDNKRSICLFESIVRLRSTIGSNHYFRVDSDERRLSFNLIAVLAFKFANVITVEEFEEYILRTWDVKKKYHDSL